MLRRLLPATLIAALAATGAVALTAAAHPAGAADPTCTAWAALPARIALRAQQVTLRTTLRGTSDCRGETTENGASATIDGPRGEHPYGQQWAHFGTRDSMQIVVGVTKLGTYTVAGGDVQLYDADYERVPFRWRATSTIVKQAAAVRATRSGGRVTGDAGHYSVDGWVASRSVAVAVQRPTTTGWTTVTRTHTDGRGRFTLTGAHRGDRVLVAGTPTAWGASKTLG